MNPAATVLYDSLCPVCRREVAFLQFAGRTEALRLVDISSPEFKPEEYGLTMAECVGSLRGLDSAGRPLVGMDTIRAMYGAAGMGWLMSWTKWPPFAPVCDAAYAAFARVRPRFSKFRPKGCDSDRCQVDS